MVETQRVILPSTFYFKQMLAMDSETSLSRSITRHRDVILNHVDREISNSIPFYGC